MRTYFIIFLNYQFLRVINLEKNAVDRRITKKGEAITRYLSRKDFVSFCFSFFFRAILLYALIKLKIIKR